MARDGSVDTVLLSGGMDSATALALLRAADARPRALFVDLGQPARAEESRCARAIAQHFDAALDEVRVAGLIIGAGETPARNLLLISAALAARAAAPGRVVLGIHAGTGYFDCGPEFVDDAQRLVDGYHGGSVQLAAPFLDMSKADIWRLADAHGVPLEATYSCELGGGPCGICRSCSDREALDAAAA